MQDIFLIEINSGCNAHTQAQTKNETKKVVLDGPHLPPLPLIPVFLAESSCF